MDEPTPLEIAQLGKQIRASRVLRRNGRGGSSAEENFVAAMRCLYRRAVDNGYLTEADNPAAKVAKPRRQEATVARCPTTVSPKSPRPRRPAVTIRHWTSCCCGSTPRRRAAVAGH
jgi:hypothetical protein